MICRLFLISRRARAELTHVCTHMPSSALPVLDELRKASSHVNALVAALAADLARKQSELDAATTALEQRAAELDARERMLNAREAASNGGGQRGGPRAPAAPPAPSNQPARGAQGVNHPVGITDLQLLASATAAALHVHAAR